LRILGFGRSLFGVAVAAILMAGCGGTQTAGVSQAATQASMKLGHAPGKSWMLPAARGADLMYVVGGCNGTCVVSYPKGKLVGTLNEPQSGPPGICADGRGNVFLSDDNAVLEYAHGGTSPIATLQLPGTAAEGCSVDPSTENLAVVFRGSGSDIAVFSGEQGQPALYNSGLDSTYCGYDNSGNLYVDGYNGQVPGFSVLLDGQSKFDRLSINSSVGNPAQVQWDGSYITYQSGSRGKTYISQIQVSGSSANIVGTVNLSGIHRWPYVSWITGKHVLVPYSNRGTVAKQLSQWSYPEGGKPTKSYKGFNTADFFNLQAVTVSAPAQ
jgi:hypothetical protein